MAAPPVVGRVSGGLRSPITAFVAVPVPLGAPLASAAVTVTVAPLCTALSSGTAARLPAVVARLQLGAARVAVRGWWREEKENKVFFVSA